MLIVRAVTPRSVLLISTFLIKEEHVYGRLLYSDSEKKSQSTILGFTALAGLSSLLSYLWNQVKLLTKQSDQ